ncbi:winged helix-turn-helix transcriptional regulator [Fusibacter tunisiensis]|jgi:DNA-binding MarR family transcriptional regulator|uniref:DNA-binding MarR family transcriptional regulator n=1 Tax=Fusibacter tunisiensis TaxID=1008308 RepID=A0ABS2MNC4_9FIRM|nr:winged helix-turn-helix transcriptional regulator [Fusibacter tunisiensis]MBM7560910.1 DNA-binding MarR family transcriptional regulator [Fusibacter tunisiensis]
MELYEISMLEVIQKHDYISQREISSEVGISLGMVNLLLKKFAKTGLIKAEKLSGNKVKYMLTPSGFSYLSKKTVDYIARSYKAVLKIQNHMLSVIQAHFKPDEMIFIYGKHDEIGQLLEDLLKTHGYDYMWIESPEKHLKYVQWQDAGADGIFILKLTG